MAHSPLGPSQAKRYINCPRSVALCASVPEESPTRYAEEGTAAHKLAEYFLLNEIYTPKLSTDWSGNLPEKYRQYYSREMVEHVRVYTEFIQLQRQCGDIILTGVEQTYSLDWLVPGIWGTCDYVIVKANGIVKVIDFKYGMGIVEVKDNTQLMIYGLMAGKSPAGSEYRTDLVDLIIVQPRPYHEDGPIRYQAAVLYPKLVKWGKKVLKSAVAETKSSKACLKCGGWCRFCRANSVCPEKKKEIMAVTKAQFSPDKKEITLPDVETLSIEKATQVYLFSQAISTWCSSVASYLFNRLEKGEKCKEIKLVRGRANRKWFDEKKVKETAKMRGIDAFNAPKLKSPAQMEKTVKKGSMDLKVFENLWTKEPGKLSLASADDPREAVEVNAIADAFLEEVDIFQ